MANRPSPAVTERTSAFWTGGAHGELRITRCQACGWWLHPPAPVCRRCHGRQIEAEATSGRATVRSFTVNRYAWTAELQPPYFLAEVELEEQPGLRLLTSIVDCEDVQIGMPVQVRFEQAGDCWIPVFAP
jgi:uncharacterized OB-fold protein